jgi:hypothetical protein
MLRTLTSKNVRSKDDYDYGNGNCGSPAAVTAGILTSQPLFIRIFRAHYFFCLIYLAVTATSLSCVVQTVLRSRAFREQLCFLQPPLPEDE